MTDTTNTTSTTPPEPTGQAADAPQSPEPAGDPTEAPEAPEGASREAARYRRQLRETEAARDALAARVQAFPNPRGRSSRRHRGMIGVAVQVGQWPPPGNAGPVGHREQAAPLA